MVVVVVVVVVSSFFFCCLFADKKIGLAWRVVVQVVWDQMFRSATMTHNSQEVSVILAFGEPLFQYRKYPKFQIPSQPVKI
jgi:hypothetical protein